MGLAVLGYSWQKDHLITILYSTRIKTPPHAIPVMRRLYVFGFDKRISRISLDHKRVSSSSSVATGLNTIHYGPDKANP